MDNQLYELLLLNKDNAKLKIKNISLEINY